MTSSCRNLSTLANCSIFFFAFFLSNHQQVTAINLLGVESGDSGGPRSNGASTGYYNCYQCVNCEVFDQDSTAVYQCPATFKCITQTWKPTGPTGMSRVDRFCAKACPKVSGDFVCCSNNLCNSGRPLLSATSALSSVLLAAIVAISHFL